MLSNISFEERIADILCRYGNEDIIAQSIRQATPSLCLDVERAQQLLRKHGLTHETREAMIR